MILQKKKHIYKYVCVYIYIHINKWGHISEHQQETSENKQRRWSFFVEYSRWVLVREASWWMWGPPPSEKIKNINKEIKERKDIIMRMEMRVVPPHFSSCHHPIPFSPQFPPSHRWYLYTEISTDFAISHYHFRPVFYLFFLNYLFCLYFIMSLHIYFFLGFINPYFASTRDN